jgi:NADH-dependent peroxiredoxin subunit C
MSLIGSEVKPFTAQAYKDGEFITVTDESLKGQWSIFCFYPADFTFVCPTELEDLQNNYEALKALGVEVYSVSTDTHFTHKGWHDSSEKIGKIKYGMIGDPSQTISRNFDVLNEEEGLADRGTFIIDPDGVIQTVEINAGGIGRDADILIGTICAQQPRRSLPG